MRIVNKRSIARELIIEQYVHNKKSLPQIAKELGVHYRTLFGYKEKFGILTHDPSIWAKGKRLSPKTEFKKGMSPWNKGKNFSEEEINRISLATKKAMERLDIKEKIQTTQFKKGVVPWNKGKSTWVTPWNKGRKNVYTDETINMIRRARLNQIFPKNNTNAELVLFEILDELKVKFSRHKPIKMICQADAFVEPNIVLFADGDYWHSNPLFYPKPVSMAQIKNSQRDKLENDKLIKEGYTVIRLWEFDLINNRKTCQDMIKKLVKNG